MKQFGILFAFTAVTPIVAFSSLANKGLPRQVLGRRPTGVAPLFVAAPPKKLQKIEQLKIDSNSLRDPLREEMKNDEIFVSQDAYQILK
jgi:sulfite reductase (ferredoxin)